MEAEFSDEFRVFLSTLQKLPSVHVVDSLEDIEKVRIYCTLRKPDMLRFCQGAGSIQVSFTASDSF